MKYYTQATLSASANGRRASAYVIILKPLIDFEPITRVRLNSDLAKSGFGHTYTYEGDGLDRT